jgi:DNA polymerase-1
MTNKGFFDFDYSRKKPVKRSPSKRKKKELEIKNPCEICGLYKDCISPKMEYTGQGLKKIFVLAEAAGKQEDEQGVQLIGKAGQKLRDELELAAGGTLPEFMPHDKPEWMYERIFDLDRDCWKMNAANCRPKDNRTPTGKEISLCRPRVIKALNELKPKKILLLGGTAIQSFLGGRVSKNLGGVNKWAGWTIPDQDYQAWVFPTYHPQYLNYQSDNIVLQNRFRNHLRTMIEWDTPFPIYNKSLLNNVSVITDRVQLGKLLMRMYRRKTPFTFDYEASGLKMQREDHRIVCCSISSALNRSVVFPWPDDPELLNLWARICGDAKIEKDGWNNKYEDSASRSRLKHAVKGMRRDGMLMSHILDNRGQISSLEFQTYIRLGILGFKGETDKFLEGTKKGENPKSDNSLNRIDECDIESLMKRCGQDSLFENNVNSYLWAQIQEKGLEGAYRLFHEGLMSFSQSEHDGIMVDVPYYEEQKVKIDEEIKDLKNKIQSSRPAKRWKEKKGEVLNPGSTTQLSELLFTIMDLKPVKSTKKGNHSVDESVLEKLSGKAPFLKHLLRIKKIEKLKNTYMEGILRETIDGKIHPSFNLHTVSSFRSSCNSPNVQNQYARWEEGKRIIRSGIIPRPGFKLKAVDYGSMEFNIAACVWEDKNMIKYASDPKSDVHRDWGMRLYKLSKDQIESKIRYHAKNSFIFPTLYGSYWENTGRNLWDNAKDRETSEGQPLIDHLKSKGIRNLTDFTSHVKDVERLFFEEFSDFAKAKEKAIKDYEEKGYIELKTGFRVHHGKNGPLTVNNILNTPVQGPAFHCLLWSYNELMRMKLEELWESFIIGQIHDEILFDCNPIEDSHINPLIREVMTVNIRKHWPWIVVPLKIEMEESKVDGNWYEMEEVEI